MVRVFLVVASLLVVGVLQAADSLPQGAGTPVPATFAQTKMAGGSSGGVQKPVVPATVSSPLEIQPFDRVEGKADAPITMIEYASMTCSHCRDFTVDVMPDVRREWIETGKVKYVFRDLPWDNLALGMSKVARCAPPQQFTPLVTALFRSLDPIMKSRAPLEEIKRVGRLAGMDGAKVENCIRDPKLQVVVTGMRDVAQKQLQVTGTPTLFINGTRVNGAPEYKDLKPILDKVYAKAAAAGGLVR